MMMDRNRGAGIVRTITGEYVNIVDTDPNTLHMHDIAWNLGRILRYNGAIRQDYTVAHHSIVMSYYVPAAYAIEALLHDAGEAYMGDIIWPVKQLFPDVEVVENKLTAVIMDKFDDNDSWQGDLDEGYKKSVPVELADSVIFGHECFSFGDRPGVYSQEMQRAWTEAVEKADGLWHAPHFAFMYRWHDLLCTDMHRSEIDVLLERAWFTYPEPEGPAEVTEAQLMEIGSAAAEMEHPE